jgi:hypothetical protein
MRTVLHIFFIDTKETVDFYGTSLGLTLNRKRGDLAIGTDCRNSLHGGRNSIVILKGGDVKAFILSMRHSDESVAIKYLKSPKTGAGALRRLLSVSNALIFVWLCVILWGERLVFYNSLAACQWEQWEQWVSDVRPP